MPPEPSTDASAGGAAPAATGDVTPTEGSRESAAPVPGHRRRVQVGDVVAGRYQLTSTLGSGAIGDTFVAQHRPLGVLVALKICRPELFDGPEPRRQLLKEAQVLATIEHPNVARVLDVGIDVEPGEPIYVVSEYARGPLLAEVLKRQRRLPVARAALIGERLAWGLAAAHARGFVHGRLSASTIILTPTPEENEAPRLFDLNLGKSLATDAAPRALALLAAPAYQAPEQIQGRAADARTDVYALGCLLYEMIAGRAPFVLSNDAVALARQVHELAEPLSKVAADVPPVLEMVVAKALAKQPEGRYAAAQEMALALARIREQRVAVTMKTQAVAAVPSSARASGRGTVAAVLVAAALGAAAGYQVARGRDRVGTVEATTALPTGGVVVVESDPPGAMVFIDGVRRGDPTPTAIADVPAGPHTVRILEAPHPPIDRQIQLGVGARVAIDVSLPPATRRLALSTVPSGARVYLDDTLQFGVTPMSVNVTDDFHQLRFEKNGYEIATRSLKPEDQGNVLPPVALLPETKPRGFISVDSSIQAAVWLDDAETAWVTPTTPFFVEAGKHTVDLRDSSGIIAGPVDVTVGDGENVHLTLEPRKATEQ